MRTPCQPQLDATARQALLGYLSTCGVDDPVALLPRALGLGQDEDPGRRLKRQRVLYRALLLLGTEVHHDSDRSRQLIAWAETGYPLPVPQDLRPISPRQREHALREWASWLRWLGLLGIETVDVDQRPTAREQRDRKQLRTAAEAAVSALSENPSRERWTEAQAAMIGYHATRQSADSGSLRRRERSVALSRISTIELPLADHPHLRPEALRRSLRDQVGSDEIHVALERLERLDPDLAARLRTDADGASLADLAWLVAQTETAQRLVALQLRRGCLPLAEAA